MDWDNTDLSLLAGALGGVYADVRSTKGLIDRGGTETNPLLGDNPGHGKLNKAGVVAALVGIAAAEALPKKYRKAFLGAWAGKGFGSAYRNSRLPGVGGKEESFLEATKKPAIAALATGLLAHHFLNDEESGVSVGPGALGPMSIAVQKKF